MNTIDTLIKKYTDALKSISDTARLDAEILIAWTANLTRTALFTHPETALTAAQEKKLHDLILRRLKGEPIAYLIGHKAFWDMELNVTADVLIPRPETECLIEWILENYTDTHLKIADLGVGSGAIALALAKERPTWTVHATDYSHKALSIAKANAEKYHLKNLHFFHGAWCKALPEKNYDIIASNPPYIESHDSHLKHLSYEPIEALDGGDDGLDDIKMIIHEAKSYLKNSGLLIFEHGFDQQNIILKFLKEAGYHNINGHKDLAKQPRFVTALATQR